MRNLQSDGQLRPVDLARAHGLSTQAVRNYEAAGILPAAERTPHGYRTYTPLHAQALRAFLALAPGHGHQTATSIMQAINRDATEDALQLIDESHAQLLDDRRTLQAVEAAVRDLEPAPPERGNTFVGPLSTRLGIRPATLRKWERAGLVQPRRDPQTGYRVYSAADVRDALLAHQLRRGGYLLEQIAPLIAQVRSAGGIAPLESMFRDWRARLSTKSRAMLSGAAALDAYLDCRPAPPEDGPSPAPPPRQPRTRLSCPTAPADRRRRPSNGRYRDEPGRPSRSSRPELVTFRDERLVNTSCGITKDPVVPQADSLTSMAGVAVGSV